MTEKRLADQQARSHARTTFDRDVLVAASAGTGKTTVLTERVLYAVTDQRLDVTRILVLTFTEAAAEEMRGRIGQKLQSVCRSSKDPFLRQQLRRLDAAPISTIHAFCKRCLDTYFFRAGLDPRAQILDEDQGALLLRESLEQTLAAAWEDPQQVTPLLELLDGRNPQSLCNTMLSFHHFLEGIPQRESWLQREHERLGHPQAPRPKLQSFWLQYHLQDIQQYLDLTQAVDQHLCEGQYLSSFVKNQISPLVHDCLAALKQGNIPICINRLQAFVWPRLPGGRSPWDAELRAQVKKPYEDARKTFNTLQQSALLDANYLTDFGAAEGRQGQTLLGLIQAWERRYSEAKHQASVLDYADLEHRLLSLLQESPNTAAALREQYDVVFLDEYQDVNAVQQAILDQIRRPAGFFAVGDIKQSIYGFRQARPTIFLGALEQAEDPMRKHRPLRLDLQTNFRCRPKVIDFSNALFARLMQPEMGGVCYDQRASLVAGRPGSDLEVQVELAVLDNDAGATRPEDLGGVTDVQRQAAWIATRIRHLVDTQTKICDRETGQQRALDYGDIVILLRSPAGRAQVYAEILRLAGIPVSSQSSAGYFASTEILDLLALLRVLDNPRQDVELAALLRSALLGFSDVDLAEIALFRNAQMPRADFYTAVKNYSTQGPETNLRARLVEALLSLDQWREQSRRIPLADLLWDIYRSTGYLSFAGALPNGNQRRANLLMLHERAIGFTDGGGQSALGSFVAHIEELITQQRDWAPAEPDSGCASTVRIMSIHRSKGLEFPVVFLADLEHSFNLSATQGSFLTDETLGLGMTVAAPQLNVTIKSPTYEAISLARRDQDLAEELRVLYVAVTRARERLILCGCSDLPQARDHRALGGLLGAKVLPATLLRRSRCCLEWVLYGCPSELDIHEVTFQELQENTRRLLDRQQDQCAQRRQLAACDPTPAQKEIRDLKRQLAWEYPFSGALQVAAKQSVSDLSHRDDAFSQLSLERALGRRPQCVLSPSSAGKSGSAARQRGTALHLIMETLDLSQSPSREAIRHHGNDLVRQGLLAEGLWEALDTEAIYAFYQGQTGAKCFEPGTKIWREWPFTLAVPAHEVPAGAAVNLDRETDFVIVQGIVDLLIQRPEGVLIVDYKTDNVPKSKLKDRARLYEGQMALYAQAAEKILRTKVLGKILYFTALQQEIPLS